MIFWPFHHVYEHDKLMTKVAAYRGEYPSVGASAMQGELEPYAEEVTKRVTDTIEKYRD